MKAYRRTENGVVTQVSLTAGLVEIDRAILNFQDEVDGMSQICFASYAINYLDGRKVRLEQINVEAPAVVEPVAEEPREWHGTHSNTVYLHRFTDDNRARCNRRFRANETPAEDSGVYGVYKMTFTEAKNGTLGHLYTFCTRCLNK